MSVQLPPSFPIRDHKHMCLFLQNHLQSCWNTGIWGQGIRKNHQDSVQSNGPLSLDRIETEAWLEAY